MRAKYGQWRYRYTFLEGIRLHWLLHAGFWRDYILNWCDVPTQIFKFLVFGNIKSVFIRFAFIQVNFFFLKLKSILTKIDISCVKS